MRSIRHRSRSRRTAQFVPMVDGLSSRIAPVSLMPLEYPLVVECESTSPTSTTESSTPTDPGAVESGPMTNEEWEAIFCQALLENLMRLEESYQSKPSDI